MWIERCWISFCCIASSETGLDWKPTSGKFDLPERSNGSPGGDTAGLAGSTVLSAGKVKGSVTAHQKEGQSGESSKPDDFKPEESDGSWFRRRDGEDDAMP